MLPPLQLEGTAPWRERFRARQIYWTQLAPGAPTLGLVGADISGAVQLYRWDLSNGELTQLTNRRDGVPFGVLAPDGTYVYYLDDARGNEIGHYVRVPLAGGSPEDITPDLPAYASWELAISGAANLIAFAAAEPDGFHLYTVEVQVERPLAPPRLLSRNSHLTIGPYLSHDGDTLVIMTAERSTTQQFSLVALDRVTGERIRELWDGPETSAGMHAFAPRSGDARLLAVTNRTGTRRPLIWNPRTGERHDLDVGDLAGQVTPWAWSPDCAQVLLCGVNQAVQQLYLYRLEDGRLLPLQHPRGTYWAAYFTPAGDIYAEWEDSTHSRRLIALDARTGNRQHDVLLAGAVPPGRPWRSITFTSIDGQAVQGWLGVPEGKGPFPAILEVHGGPTSWVSDQFSPASQAWLDHGFAFLTINYRGSPTFGRAFEEQVYGDVGHWEVEDMVAARRWLVERGIAHPDQVLLTGWSYGGYLTLHALGTRPDLWAGGMVGTAIADWTMTFEDLPPNNRQWQVGLLGGTPTEVPGRYAASSPITYIQQLRAPVLVIQGRHDSRCPSRQMEAYLEEMRRQGKSIGIQWFDAGHAVLNVEERIEHQELMLRFAYDVLQQHYGGTVAPPGTALT